MILSSSVHQENSINWVKDMCILSFDLQSTMLRKSLQFYLSTASNRQILRWRNFSMRSLDNSDRNKCFDLLSYQLTKREPLALSYYNQATRAKSRQQCRDFLEFFAQEFFKQPISIGCFDLQKNEELVGAIMGKNFHATPSNITQKFPQGTLLNTMFTLFGAMFSQLDSQKQAQLLDKSLPIVDHWAGAIKEEYLGRKIYYKLRSASILAAHRANYRYAFGWTSNIRSAKTLKRLGYDQLLQYDVSKFELQGVSPFLKVAQEQKIAKFWLKNMGEDYKLPIFQD